MTKRIPQPPVNPALRSLEHHDFWPGLAVAVAGLALLYYGARHMTSVDTVDGEAAWETQIIKAFSTSGLQYANRQPAPRPPKLDGVANPAEVLDRWAQEQANKQPAAWKIRVDVGAKTPCPT